MSHCDVTAWELFTHALAIAGAARTAMVPFFALMVWHTWWSERCVERGRREDRERWERPPEPDSR